MEAYEKFHIGMARNIQRLPENCPLPSILASLGWMDIQSLIDISKLLFGYRMLSLVCTSVYRIVMVKRFYCILYSYSACIISPLGEFISLCRKYNLLSEVESWLESGDIICKHSWKKLCKQAVMDYSFPRWRLQLKLYRKLSTYRVIQLFITPSVWWCVARNNVKLKMACCTVLRLLNNCDRLRINIDVSVPRNERLCECCTKGEVEDLYHMLMSCLLYNDICETMINKIDLEISEQSRSSIYSLSPLMQYYIYLGLDFPISQDDLICLREISCQAIHKMYCRRLNF